MCAIIIRELEFLEYLKILSNIPRCLLCNIDIQPCQQGTQFAFRRASHMPVFWKKRTLNMSKSHSRTFAEGEFKLGGKRQKREFDDSERNFPRRGSLVKKFVEEIPTRFLPIPWFSPILLSSEELPSCLREHGAERSLRARVRMTD